MAAVRLKPGREKSLLRKHPWVFSGAIDRVTGSPENGETIEVQSSDGKFLAWGSFSASSQIRVRIWSWQREEVINKEFFKDRLAASIAARRNLIFQGTTNAFRLVYGESDGLPGVIVDQYDQYLVTQFLCAGAERWRNEIWDLLVELTGASGIYDRSDVEVRKLEGLQERTGLYRGSLADERFQILENGLKFWVDLKLGHKTGSYLDQRENRAIIGQLARNQRVLDCFTYTGGFAVNSLLNGAESVAVIDASAEALALLKENLLLNDLKDHRVEIIHEDVFKTLRRMRDQARDFSLIILDPPKFAPTAAQARQAARGYKDINLLALKLLAPGGLLATFSCSGGVDMDLFQKILAGAALDAQVSAQIVRRLSQGPDHPVALNYPESAYLKGLILRRI